MRHLCDSNVFIALTVQAHPAHRAAHPVGGATMDDIERTFTDIEKQNEDLIGSYRNAKKGLSSLRPGVPKESTPKKVRMPSDTPTYPR